MRWVLSELRAGWISVRIFFRIGGERRAAAIAFHGLLGSTLFAALLLAVVAVSGRLAVLASQFVAGVPVEQGREFLARTVAVSARVPVGFILVWGVGLIWSLVRIHQLLGAGVARAWRNREQGGLVPGMRELPLLAALHSGLFIGVVLPFGLLLLAGLRRDFSPAIRGVYGFCLLCVSAGTLLHGLVTFYGHTPRQPLGLRETWGPALAVALVLAGAPHLMAPVLPRLARLGGAVGPWAIALLFLAWAHVSACLLLWGACLCAARGGQGTDQSKRRAKARPGGTRATQLEFGDAGMRVGKG